MKTIGKYFFFTEFSYFILFYIKNHFYTFGVLQPAVALYYLSLQLYGKRGVHANYNKISYSTIVCEFFSKGASVM